MTLRHQSALLSSAFATIQAHKAKIEFQPILLKTTGDDDEDDANYDDKDDDDGDDEND